MIPPFDERGLLPPGVHTATWTDAAVFFDGDARRMGLIANARAFALGEVAPLFPLCPLYLAGSTFSDKPYPGDIEACITVPMDQLLINNGFAFAHGLQSRHDDIKARYEVDFYVSFGMPGAPDFSVFFQYVGEKTAAMKHLAEKDKRGIIEVTQWTNG